jgi:hypothetical protein
MIEAIEIYFACLENPHSIDYYYEVMEGMSCLVLDAMNARKNVELANWNQCLPLIGWCGILPMSPGS